MRLSNPLLVLFLAAPALAQRDLATVFPAQSWAYAGHAGLDAGVQAFDAAGLVALARQMLGAEGWKEIEAMVRANAGRDFEEAVGALERMGLDSGRVRSLLAGPVALAVGRPTFMGDKPVPSIGLAVVVRDRAAFQRGVEDLEALAAQAAPVSLGEATVAGIRCRRIELPGGAGALLHGMVDDVWLATNSEGFLADCVAAVRGQAPNLAANPSLARGRTDLAGARLGELFVNLRQFSASFAPIVPYEFERVGRALGVSDLPDLYFGTAYDGKSAHDVLQLLVPGAKDGLFKAALSQPASNAAAKWVKPGTVLFASARIDARGVGAAFERMRAALPEAAAQEMQRELDRELGRELRRELGMSLDELLGMLSSLGSEISVAIDMPRIDFRQDNPGISGTFTVFVELADPQAAQATLERLAEGRLGRAAAETTEGVTVWTIDTEVEGMRMSPTWGIRDGWLVASNFKNTARRVLREGPLAQGSLADDPRFRAAAQAASGASLFLTARLEPVLKSYWGVAEAGLRIGASQIGLEPEEVPSGEDVAAATADVVLAVRADEHGFALRSVHPTGLGSLLAATAAGVDWFLRQAPRKVY